MLLRKLFFLYSSSIFALILLDPPPINSRETFSPFFNSSKTALAVHWGFLSSFNLPV